MPPRAIESPLDRALCSIRALCYLWNGEAFEIEEPGGLALRSRHVLNPLRGIGGNPIFLHTATAEAAGMG